MACFTAELSTISDLYVDKGYVISTQWLDGLEEENRLFSELCKYYDQVFMVRCQI